MQAQLVDEPCRWQPESPGAFILSSRGETKTSLRRALIAMQCDGLLMASWIARMATVSHDGGMITDASWP